MNGPEQVSSSYLTLLCSMWLTTILQILVFMRDAIARQMMGGQVEAMSGPQVGLKCQDSSLASRDDSLRCDAWQG